MTKDKKQKKGKQCTMPVVSKSVCVVCKVDDAVVKGKCTTCYYDCP